MEFEGTQGEWIGGIDRIYMDHEGGFKVEIGKFHSNGKYISFEEMRANTQIAVASKELLEALQLSQNFLKTIQPMLADSKDWSDAINAGIKSNQEAINKAFKK